MSVAQSPDRKTGGSVNRAVPSQVQVDHQGSTNANRLPSRAGERPARTELGQRSTSFRSSSSQHNPSNTAVDLQASVSSQPQDSSRMSRKLSQHLTSSVSSRSLNRTASNASCHSSHTSRRPSTPSASHAHQVEEGLSCNEHAHTCLPCAQDLAAYASSQFPGATGSTTSNQGSTPAGASFRKASRGNRQKSTGSQAQAVSSALQKSASCALDACAVCGIALGLSLVATDYVCVLAGGVVGLIFVPATLLLSIMAAGWGPPGQSTGKVILEGISMAPRICAAALGVTGKIVFCITSGVGWYIGKKAAKRLQKSKRISENTAYAISRLLFPGPALLQG